MEHEAVDFDVIEQQKENIEPLREGRSARGLKHLFSVPQDQLKTQQQEERSKIEDEFANIEELDDPLQLYLDYIQWINKNYPSGVTVESGLVQVLEKCTSHFRDVSYYKNDPRYLRVWLNYAKYSENPRDIFVYLARKEIGKSLATFYEEYANYLESNDRNLQADKVYKQGIELEARPLQRLQKRYDEFQLRFQTKRNLENEPQSPVFPVRSVLSVKSGSLFATHDKPKTLKRKLEVFNDDEEADNGSKVGGWDTLGSAKTRNKENRMESKPWAGEVLKQDLVNQANYNKVSVFKDGSLGTSGPVYKIIETPGKRTEKVDMNFSLLYQEDEEFCVQEIFAIMRGVYTQTDRQPPLPVQSSPPMKSLVPNFIKRSQANETIRLNTIDLKKKVSPTATFFTKEAKDEVYSMFNQKPVNTEERYEEDEDAEFIYDNNYTEQLTTRSNLNDLTNKVNDLDIQRRMEEENLKQEIINKVCIVNPADENLKEILLSELSPPIKTYDGIFKYSKPLSMISTLKKSLNLKQTKHVFLEFKANGNTFNLKSLLGEGGYASVYLAESMTGGYKAIKAQKPSSSWEFYILKQIEERLAESDVLNSIIKGDEIHLYEDESYLILDYIKQGTILDIVNHYRSVGRSVEESLIVFVTVELLKVIEALHDVGIMHSDLKADNVMLRLNEFSSSQSWKARGIKLIDFGRSIDMRLFPKNVQFKSNWKTDNQDCPEMRNGDTWTYQVDYFGIAGVIHTMLYGNFIETSFNGERYRLTNPLKRYWNQELWSPLFDLLMNSAKFGEFPITEKLREHRLKMEAWLEDNSGNLLGVIRDIETGLK